MACDKEQIYLPIANCFLEPPFLNCLRHWLDHSVIGVIVEIIKEPESQDADALILGSELLITLSQQNKIYPVVATGVEFKPKSEEDLVLERETASVLLKWENGNNVVRA